MKKLIALLLALVMVLALAACARTAGGGAFRRDRAGRAAGVEQRRSGGIGNNAV